jgi:hypothetical protein
VLCCHEIQAQKHSGPFLCIQSGAGSTIDFLWGGDTSIVVQVIQALRLPCPSFHFLTCPVNFSPYSNRCSYIYCLCPYNYASTIFNI